MIDVSVDIRVGNGKDCAGMLCRSTCTWHAARQLG